MGKSVTLLAINTLVKATEDASERSFHKFATAEWFPFVQRMGDGEPLSLVKEAAYPGMVPLFHSVDTQIVEVLYAIKTLTRKSW